MLIDCLCTTRAQEGWGLSGLWEPTWWWHNTAHVYSAAPSVLCSLYRCTVHCTTHWFPMSHVRPRGQRSPIRSDDCEISPTKHQHPHTLEHITLGSRSSVKSQHGSFWSVAVGWWQALNWSTFAASPVNAEAIKCWILIQNYPQSWAHVMWLFKSFRRLKVCLLQHV